MTTVVSVVRTRRAQEGQPVRRDHLIPRYPFSGQHQLPKTPPIIQRRIDDRAPNLRPASIEIHDDIGHAGRLEQTLLRKLAVGQRPGLWVGAAG